MQGGKKDNNGNLSQGRKVVNSNHNLGSSDSTMKDELSKNDPAGSFESLKDIGKNIDEILQRQVKDKKKSVTNLTMEQNDKMESTKLNINSQSSQLDLRDSDKIKETVMTNKKTKPNASTIDTILVLDDTKTIPTVLNTPVSKILDNLGSESSFRIVQGQIVPNPKQQRIQTSTSNNDINKIGREVEDALVLKDISSSQIKYDEINCKGSSFSEKSDELFVGTALDQLDENNNLNVDGKEKESNQGGNTEANTPYNKDLLKYRMTNSSAQESNDNLVFINELNQNIINPLSLDLNKDLGSEQDLKDESISDKKDIEISSNFFQSKSTPLNNCTIRKIQRKPSDNQVAKYKTDEPAVDLLINDVLNSFNNKVEPNVDGQSDFTSSLPLTISENKNSIGIHLDSDEITSDLDSVVIHISIPKKDKPTKVSDKEVTNLNKENLNQNRNLETVLVNKITKEKQQNADTALNELQTNNRMNHTKAESTDKVGSNFASKLKKPSIYLKNLTSQDIKIIKQSDPDYLENTNTEETSNDSGKSKIGSLYEKVDIKTSYDASDNIFGTNSEYANSDNLSDKKDAIDQSNQIVFSIEDPKKEESLGLITKFMKSFKKSDSSVLSLGPSVDSSINKEELPKTGHVKKLIEFFENNSTINQ